MSYDYQALKPKIFTEDGQVTFLRIRDHAQDLFRRAGAARLEEIISVTTGDTWTQMACVDRLVELGEIREIEQTHRVAGQHRIFVKKV